MKRHEANTAKAMGVRRDFRVCCHHIATPTNRIHYPTHEPLMTWDEADKAAKKEQATGYMHAWVVGRDGLGANRPTEADHYLKCGECGGQIDCRNLSAVLAHEGPLPHPPQDQLQ